MTGWSVACGHQVTGDAAASVLAEGGTAVDAAIAGAMAAMVAEPVLAGLLGGGFLMVRAPNKAPIVLDFFVQTPRAAKPEQDLDFRAIEVEFGTASQTFHIGAGTIATPGVACGLAEAHERFGRMPMAELAIPAINAARAGVTVTPYQGELSQMVRAILMATPSSQALFCAEDGPAKAGAVLRNPDLADVLEVFSREGSRFVTEGEVAQGLLSVTDQGGHLTALDLRRYRATWRTPLMVERAAAKIHVNPPPSLGGILAAFSLDLMDRDPDPVTIALAFEATSRARLEVDLDRAGAEGAFALLSPDLLKRYRKDVQRRRAAVQGTTHISVIDAKGMGAAITLSNGAGSGLIVPGTGIMPNNMLGEEDLSPGGWHQWPRDQRLASMMCPMAVEWPDGRFAMLGSGGSNRIRTALVQVLLGLLDGNLPLDKAIEAARLHVEPGDPTRVDFEDLGGDERRERLLSAFEGAQPWPDLSMFFGGVHGVMRSARGDLSGAGDPRRAGYCAGSRAS